MKQFMAVLTLIGVLVQTGVVYPQAMKVHSVEEGKSGNYTVTLRAADGNQYDVVTDLDDVKDGETMAVLMYSNMTLVDVRDDAVVAMRHTGLFEKEGG